MGLGEVAQVKCRVVSMAIDFCETIALERFDIQGQEPGVLDLCVLSVLLFIYDHSMAQG